MDCDSQALVSGKSSLNLQMGKKKMSLKRLGLLKNFGDQFLMTCMDWDP